MSKDADKSVRDFFGAPDEKEFFPDPEKADAFVEVAPEEELVVEEVEETKVEEPKVEETKIESPNGLPKFKRVMSEETKQKIREKMKGRTHSEEARQKLSEKMKERFKDEDIRRKISEGIRAAHAAKKNTPES